MDRRTRIRQCVWQSFSLAASVAKSQEVSAQEFVWSLSADLQATQALESLWEEVCPGSGDELWREPVASRT